MSLKSRSISAEVLVVISSIILSTFYNIAFFHQTSLVYPVNGHNLLFYFSLYINLLMLNILIISLFNFKKTLKPALIIIFFLTTLLGYPMKEYGVVFDESMLLSILKTDPKEVADLFDFKLMLTLFFGIIPGIILWFVRINYVTTRKNLLNKLIYFFVPVLISALTILIFSRNYASFFREHKSLRYYVNPYHAIFSGSKMILKSHTNQSTEMEKIGNNAKIDSHDIDRDLMILVIGETARADRFSLNGYHRETNSLLKNEEVFSFKKMTSCGTSTAVSVPCMFSKLRRSGFSSEKANSTENLLDILKHTSDVSILWRDNNSDSKGVALRVEYHDFQSKVLNPICDPECRDIGMLSGLQEYINKEQHKDILIVLHQMGNHGPAYYKRYPKEFEKFKPACQFTEIEKCNLEEINNAYDNAVFYTDYFLSKTIELLKQNSQNFNTSMFYISDHGESLGENGIFLHGLPYFMAPKEQKDVAAVLWLGEGHKNNANLVLLRRKLTEDLSHDNIFHTVLGLFEVQTKEYNKSMDILDGILKHY
jgi:lipid A ethanolaminephosphotransferase